MAFEKHAPGEILGVITDEEEKEELDKKVEELEEEDDETE